MLACCLAGCGAVSAGKSSGEKLRDLEFTVVGSEAVPQELQKLIDEKKEAPFKLTYTNDQGLYIVNGYGRQESGGFSIAVKELYLTDNAILFDTELLGPEKGEDSGSDPSFPYIVVQTESREEPVIFQ